MNDTKRGSFSRPSHSKAATDPGFTLLELLVVLGILSLLAATLVPTLAGSRIGVQAFRCLNNSRQLCAAWRMFADDNHDTVVYASDDGTRQVNPNNQYAWTWTHIDHSPSPYNWDPSVDITQRALWPYTAKDPSIYRCPSDSSFVVVNRVIKPRVRSFSMNLYLGGFAPPSSFPPGSPGTDYGLPNFKYYRIFSKTTDLTVLPPAKAFVFIDERPDAINWGNFFTSMSGYLGNPPTLGANPALYEFGQDFPAMFHHFGSSVSFADGRAEIHRWTDPRTSSYTPTDSAYFSPRNPDIAWLQDHATRPK